MTVPLESESKDADLAWWWQLRSLQFEDTGGSCSNPLLGLKPTHDTPSTLKATLSVFRLTSAIGEAMRSPLVPGDCLVDLDVPVSAWPSTGSFTLACWLDHHEHSATPLEIGCSRQVPSPA